MKTNIDTLYELKSFARLLKHERELDLSPEVREKVRQLHVLMLGTGSIGRQLAEILCDLGARNFTLVDPKRYSQRSVGQQCTASEVGQLKVEVVADELRRRSARVAAFACDLFELPDGVVQPGTYAFLTVDNRRADIGGNHLLTRMRGQLVKANVEPAYDLASVRVYDMRDQVELCVECQFGARQYAQQRHPKSCDAGSVQRRTASPPELARAAAGLGALALLGTLRGGDAAAQWAGHQLQCSLSDGTHQASRLDGNPNCRWDHGSGWPNLTWFAGLPEQVSLAELLVDVRGGRADRGCSFTFCQHVALYARCNACGEQQRTIRWVPEIGHAVGACACGGQLLPMPFWCYRRLEIDQLRPVLHRPLHEWGVPPLAVISVAGTNSKRTYVIGGPPQTKIEQETRP